MTNSPYRHLPAAISNCSTFLLSVVPKVLMAKLQPQIRLVAGSPAPLPRLKGLNAHPLAKGKRSLSSCFHCSTTSPSPLLSVKTTVDSCKKDGEGVDTFPMQMSLHWKLIVYWLSSDLERLSTSTWNKQTYTKLYYFNSHIKIKTALSCWLCICIGKPSG